MQNIRRKTFNCMVSEKKTNLKHILLYIIDNQLTDRGPFLKGNKCFQNFSNINFLICL